MPDLFTLSTGGLFTSSLSYFSSLGVPTFSMRGGKSMSKPHPRRTRHHSRPWIVPPGLLIQGEPFEGYHVLDETRDELGVLLWQCLRDVEIWATSAPQHRSELFTANALRQRMERIDEEVDPASPVRPVLEGLAGLL